MKSTTAMHPMDRLTILDEAWSGCTACRLNVGRNQVVGWRGNPTAPLVLVGEAPGEEEDRMGRPFVGPAGRLLDSLLQAAGLDPNEHVFITNLVGCRPPGNRKPEADEAKACRPRLEGMLEIVRPRVLVLLGSTAAQRMAGCASITAWRGQLTQVETWKLIPGVETFPAIPTFHPSYLLRNKNPALDAQVVEDLKLAQEKTRGI